MAWYTNSIKVMIFDIDDEDVECDYCQNTAVRHLHIPPFSSIMVCSYHLNNQHENMPEKFQIVVQDSVPVCSAHINDGEIQPLHEEAKCEYCHDMAVQRIAI